MTVPHPESILATADLLIGIDDTDSLESRGTGRMSQALLAVLRDRGLGTPLGVTRHQLLVDPRIPYTSHNSSACIVWRTASVADRALVIAEAGHFLDRETPPEADPGLAVAAPAQLEASTRESLVSFGQRAKTEVLLQEDALDLARLAGIHLSGHGGSNGGVLGALAAIGLHLSGDDGRFIWMDGIRGLSGSRTASELLALAPIDDLRDRTGRRPARDELIELGEWVRPVLEGGRAVLLLDAPQGNSHWRAASRDVVKTH